MQWKHTLLALGVHLVLFYSIFDIYFTSPLLHGMTPHSCPLPPPAQRLVLFVADGLRADKVFELNSEGKSRAPFIRNIIEKRGAWGVSHTRVPTESRPGNVAIIAGFYEDVSAVAKGWKENPVEFDSLFNESRYTWSWGSPDILPMFAKGASGDHVFINTYPAESEDFASADNSLLDSWVFDEFQKFLQGSSNNETLADMLQKDGIVTFLHLLGIDTNGHAHRPYSDEYLQNIALVDAGIQRMESMIEDYYGNDGRTAYILTSDHGMTNWGSHGAGHPTETLTPIVAWGAGIRSASASSTVYDDELSESWNLSHIERADINQADIAALMAATIGINYPMNSVGILPIHYLSTSDHYKAEALYANALQILDGYTVSETQKQETTLQALFTPFSSLLPGKRAELRREIRTLSAQGRYKEAAEISRKLADLALSGLQYYHNYDRVFLGFSVTMCFIAWMAYVGVLLLRDHTTLVPPRTRLDEINSTGHDTPYNKSFPLIMTASVLTVIVLFVQKLPATYYLYCLTPLILAKEVAQNSNVFVAASHSLIDRAYAFLSIKTVVLAIVGIEVIVLAFFYREVLSIGLVCLSFMPATMPASVWRQHRITCISWCVSCLILAIFPLLPVVGRDANYGTGAVILLVEGYNLRQNWSVRSNRQVTLLQITLIGISTVVIITTSVGIAQKTGVPVMCQYISWFVLVSCPLWIFLSGTGIVDRLRAIILSLLPVYLLLSTSYETLFLLSLLAVLYCWIKLERANLGHVKYITDFTSMQTGTRERMLEYADLHRAYIFIFLLLVSFFGTGNIASINSFDPTSVLCFLSIFSPFTMGALLMVKVLLPFVIVSVCFCAVAVTARIPLYGLSLLVLLGSDMMALNFFFLVQDSGSWLDIGTSISHYVIVMTTTVVAMLLLTASRALTTFTIRLPTNNKNYNR